MSIEQTLDRIATALEKIAANGAASNVMTKALVEDVVSAPADDGKAAKAKADAAAAKAKADAAAAKAKVDADAAAAKAKAKAEAEAEAEAAVKVHFSGTKATKDDIRKALQGFREIEGTPAMLEVLKAFGATNLNELDESKYDEVLAKVS